MLNVKEVGGKARERRRELGLRREDIAVRASVAVSTIDKLEQGRGLPKVEILDKIAEALGTSVAELLAALRQPVAA